MSNHKGAVPEWLNSQYIENILRQSESSEDLKVLKIDISPGSVEGDNYMCQMFRIEVHYQSNNQEMKTSLIAKYKLKTKLLESVEGVIDAFAVEVNFFNDMPNLFKKVLNKKEIDFLPKCHYLDWDNNLIVMEDLVPSRYKLQTKGQFLNKKQCSLVFEGLAELHGASYKALEIQPDLKNKYHKSFFASKNEGPLEKLIDNSLKFLKKSVKLYGLTQNQEQELLKLKEKLDADWFKVCDLEEDRLNFLLHGDCWKNNMMFHTSGEKVKLLDFQIYNYNCFANDLQYFLFTSADADVIVNDIDYLLETYYTKLYKVAPEIPNLTLERVKKEFAERYFFGFALSIVFRPVMSADPPPDMEKVLDGLEVPMGFDSETYVKHLPILMEFFDKVGVFKI